MVQTGMAPGRGREQMAGVAARVLPAMAAQTETAEPAQAADCRGRGMAEREFEVKRKLLNHLE